MKAALDGAKTQLPVINTGILATAELPICIGKAGSPPTLSDGVVGWSINNRNADYVYLKLGDANLVVVNFRIVWLATIPRRLGRGSLVSWNIPSLKSPQLGHKAFLREDASHFGDMSSSGKTISAGNPRESLDHQFKRLFAEARLPPFPLAQL